MYKPTKIEKSNCIQIVKDILKIDDEFECERYVENIFRKTYSIGGDYSKETLRSVAEVILKDVQYLLGIFQDNLEISLTT